MKKMKSFMAGLLGAVMLCGALSLTACGDKEDTVDGQLYELQEAYDLGLLTKNDLQDIAEKYFDNMWDNECETQVVQEFGKATVSAIKKAELKDIKSHYPNTDLTVDDLHIVGYYGTYKQCAALRISSGWYPDVEEEVVVAGVTFAFTGPFIRLYTIVK